jgi:hypothetical protein
MLQAHSFLWNYLWVAPNLFLLMLGLLLWRRGMWRQIPAFVTFATLGAVGQLAVFGADIAPWVSAENFWRIDWASLLLGGVLKFAVIGEVFSRVFGSYLSISRIGRVLVTAVGAALVLLAGLIAAFGQGDSTEGLVAGAHLIEQTVFIIESGLILFLLLFAAYFRLSWDRLSLGVLVGLAISSFEHLATWAIVANASPSDREHGNLSRLCADLVLLPACAWEGGGEIRRAPA